MYIKVLVDNHKLFLTKVYTSMFCEAGANAN